jgi:hypothetical protein
LADGLLDTDSQSVRSSLRGNSCFDKGATL